MKNKMKNILIILILLSVKGFSQNPSAWGNGSKSKWKVEKSWCRDTAIQRKVIAKSFDYKGDRDFDHKTNKWVNHMPVGSDTLTRKISVIFSTINNWSNRCECQSHINLTDRYYLKTNYILKKDDEGNLYIDNASFDLRDQYKIGQ